MTHNLLPLITLLLNRSVYFNILHCLELILRDSGNKGTTFYTSFAVQYWPSFTHFFILTKTWINTEQDQGEEV